MARRKFRFAICLLLVLAVCGCENAGKDNTPDLEADGFYVAGQIVPGGGTQEAVDINARALSAAVVEGESEGALEETVITLSFVSGSRISGNGEETAGCGVPAYSVYTLRNPARLIISLDNIAFWDYRRDMSLEAPLIHGMFQHSFVSSPRVDLYFQLAQPVGFRCETDGDTLRIRLQPVEQEEAARYFVSANAYEEYISGVISPEFNSSPTLANDLKHMLLISPAMETEEEAQAYLLDATAQYPSIEEEKWQVLSLEAGELPPYDIAREFVAAYQTPVIRLQDGRELTLPVIAPDGEYLCDMPGGDGFLYSREIPSEGQDIYEQLYIMRRDGQSVLATNFEFSAIEQAAFSPDGRKLAVLERAGERTHLDVFDADTFELLNDLSEMGFGSNTSRFIWNSLGNTLYAITGTADVQLHQFDYSIPDETKRHSLVDRNSADEGSLGFCDGELYFTFATLEGGSTIYRIKPEGGVRKPFLSGERFSISGDGRYMAIAQTSESSASSNALVLYEFAAGSSITINGAIYPYDMFWSKDCSKLYYIENRLSGGQNELDTSGDEDAAEENGDAAGAQNAASKEEQDAFPYTLWVYEVATGENQRLFDMRAPNAFAGETSNTMRLCLYETNSIGVTHIRATYHLNVEAVLEEVPQEEAAPNETAQPSPQAG